MVTITRRQVVLAFFALQTAAISFLVTQSISQYADIRNAPLEISVLLISALLGMLYWRGWEQARYVNAAMLIAATVLGVDTSYGAVSASFIALCVPILLLLLADYPWVIAGSVIIMGYLGYEFWSNGTFIGPFHMTLYIMAIVAMTLSRMIADSDQRAAEAHARHAEEARKLIETQTAALHENEQRFRLIAEHIDEVFWLATASDDQILYVSPAYERLYGQSCAAFYANPMVCLEVIHSDDRERVRHCVEQSVIERRECEVFLRVMQPGQPVRWLWSACKPIWDDAGKVIGRVGIAKDITERKVYEDQIEYLAYTDTLTHLPNRNRLYELGEAALINCHETGEPFILLYLDLDRFKRINDTLGHDAGDMVLTWVGVRLHRCVQHPAQLFRLGGDEFAVLLPDSDIYHGLDIAQEILLQLQRPFTTRGEILHLDVSIGVAVSSPDDASFSAVLTRADIAMYQAKADGNGVQVYNPLVHPLLRDRLQLENELRRLLQDAPNVGHLLLHYQPIIDVQQHQVVMFESLVRWQHPTRGLLGPGAFLPLAEEARIMDVLDRKICVMVLHQVAAWYAQGQAITVTINLSAQSLRNPDLADEFARLLHTTGIPARLVVVEVTEHTAMHDLAMTEHVLLNLRRLGIRVALDDFGSGYASLKYLRHLPVDVLKLDKAFAAGIGRDTQDEAVIEALLALGRGLDLTVLVEGIEKAEQLTWLRMAGCTLAQGYAIGRPQPSTQLDLKQAVTGT